MKQVAVFGVSLMFASLVLFMLPPSLVGIVPPASVYVGLALVALGWLIVSVSVVIWVDKELFCHAPESADRESRGNNAAT